MTDHQAVTRQVYEYAYGLDLKDFDRYRAVFTSEVTMDFSSYSGGAGTEIMPIEHWIARTQPLFLGLDATQHSMTNPLVDVDGNSARCRMYMQAVHMLNDDPNPEFTIGGYYDDQLVRTANGWKISAVTLTVLWRRGNPAIMAVALARGKALLAGPSD